jgi:hypothetical protein
LTPVALRVGTAQIRVGQKRLSIFNSGNPKEDGKMPIHLSFAVRIFFAK